MSEAPLQALLCSVLLLYSLDLANLRDACIVTLWLCFALVSGTNSWTLLMATEDHEAKGGTMLVIIFRMMVETLFFLCLATWSNLQFQWMYKDSHALTKMAEQILHGCLVPVSATILTHQLMTMLVDNVGVDQVANIAPYLFAFFLLAGMWFFGSCKSSYATTGKDEGQSTYCIMNSMAWVHSVMLLLIPPLMHLLSFRKRILSKHASFDEWHDLILVWTVPYLLHFVLHLCHAGDGGPYSLSILYSKSTNTLRGAFFPIMVSILASLSLQQKYIIPICQMSSYQFLGHNTPSHFITGLYLTASTLTALLSFWVHGKVSTTTNEPLFGEYQDDVVQLSLALSGMFAGRAFGMPWNLTPLPILAFLGFTVWLTSRMLRYLAVLLFVLHSSALVIFSYRFAGIETTIALAVPGVTLNLMRFGMVSIVASVLVGLTMGLAVRSNGGFGSATLKKFDIGGILLLVYSILLTILECTLLKEAIPFQTLTGIEVLETESEMDAMVYSPLLAFTTSGVLVVIVVLLLRCKIVGPKSGILVVSMAVGKAMAVFIDINEVQKRGGDHDAFSLLLRALVAMFTLSVLLGPRAFLKPIHIKSSTIAMYKRNLSPHGKPASDTPGKADQAIMAYALIILPITLVISIPLVLQPLLGSLSSHYGGAYYSLAPVASEVMGFSASLWGLSLLLMLNHYLPDGGGDVWKKISALTFLMGLGIAISAPTIPDWARVLKRARQAPNPFAALSSIGSQMIIGNRSRAGGWGLISASLATILAVSGPLELQERRDSTGKKDKFLLLRMMIFSIMFGCGVSWFITLQSMSEEAFLSFFVTAIACMAMSFFGTVAAVLGYFLELENFDEVEAIVKLWAGAFPVFGITASLSQFLTQDAHPFGIGGWCSTYLSVCSFVAFIYTLILRSRPTKSAATRGIGNLSCILAWFCTIVVIFGKYGVAGLDAGFDVTKVAGLSASVFGTLLVSLLLLALEGESGSSGGRSRVRRISDNASQYKPSFGLSLTQLKRSNALAPVIAAVVSVFVIATAYAIFIRGCSNFFDSDTNHQSMFHAVFGKVDRSNADSELAYMAERSALHSQAVVTSAKLARSSFWMAANPMGPLLYLGGMLATIPGLYLLVTYLWSGIGIQTAQVTLAAPLNMIPLVFCRGIPTLTAAATIGFVGGLLQLTMLRKKDQQARMRI